MVREPLIPYHPLTGPAMRACLLFIAGILLAQRTDLNIICVYLCSSVVIFLFFLCVLLNRHDTLATLAATAVMVCAGMAAYTIAADIHRPVDIPTELFNSRIVATGRVTGQCRYSHGNTTWTLACSEITIGDSSYRVSGELTCTFFDRQIPLDEGSPLTVEGKLLHIRPILTRRDFQFDAVTQKQAARLIVDSIRARDSSSISAGTFFDRVRRTVSHLIDRYPYGGHRAIVKAITIGERKGIPPETNKQWAQSGIAHILAVSGLHVGILMMVVTFLLRLLPLSKASRFTMTVLFVILYAGICGFLPPVSRAVIMFTLLTGASLIERPGNVENSLFAALIIILAFDPRALFGASLQLSFAAVWTITTFYMPLYNLLGEQIHHSKPVRYVLSLAILSTLATVGTAPIVAAHFGFLPVYGILTNLVAVPLAINIVIVGLLSITATALGAFATPVAHLLSVLTGLLLSILNWIAAYVSSLPHSRWQSIAQRFFRGVVLRCGSTCCHGHRDVPSFRNYSCMYRSFSYS